MPYLTKSKKTEKTRNLIEQALEILDKVGIPIEVEKQRAIEKMAMVFLAVAGVTEDWQKAQGLKEKRFLKTKEIIPFINSNFEENMSPGSYDDVRRKDLKLLVLDGLIVKSTAKPNAATNDPTRAYALENGFADLVRTFGTEEWQSKLAEFLNEKPLLRDALVRKREIKKVNVTLPDGKKLEFSAGQHNLLQKQIIENFLSRFGGKDIEVLYVGDTADKFLCINKGKLKELHFFELSHNELPDVIAYSQENNWLFLIEAVHSSGSINEVRLLELKRLTEKCKAEIIYVTAFLTKADFRKKAAEIAWETEAWIAENPDHLIHFNGEKFLGAYKA